ncbi:NAD kinase [Dermabacter sp. Marseille-Q3180]|uniref:NAD kinase n=1 Tax=Dermabacter sp. Marseille-Q3180 TaxID=2758090 RepID=UPI0024E12937|nr:NAD kinase [Dermabacter sp. Marseille-Q3180]
MLYVHTGRVVALKAARRVAQDLHAAGVKPTLTRAQAEEIAACTDEPEARALVETISAGQLEVLDQEKLPAETELCIVLGGDGTILRALELIRPLSIPVHGVNLGHVGFLAESEVAELGATVRRLLARDYVLEARSVIRTKAFAASGALLYADWALNEASLEKSERARMIYVVVGIDGRPVSEFGCDGVLLSSPTGSTAYAFSAGGPVMWPEVDAMLLVPLAAHALFARPLVMGRSSVVEIEISPDSPSPALLTLDGRRQVELPPGSRLETHLSKSSVHFARFAETPFADRLVEKFKLPVEGWRGGNPDARYEPGAEES